LVRYRDENSPKIEELLVKKKHIGSNLDDFLQEESLLENATAVAVKRVIAWEMKHEMAKQQLSKTSMAKKMHTRRAT
jgi:hypothetical protein